MSWKNPDAEIHLIGWPAVLVGAVAIIWGLNTVFRAVIWAFGI